MPEPILLQRFADETTNAFQLDCSMLRLDLLHPVVSGNKIFKLKFYLDAAAAGNKKSVITFGGSHSNHLVATAYAAQQKGLQAIGIVRGEAPSSLSPTLIECRQYGMELEFIARSAFGQINLDAYHARYPDALIIPHGGLGLPGVKGAATILDTVHTESFDTIMAACGTGTMGAGLISAAKPHQKVILISVLKNNFSVKKDIDRMLDEMHTPHAYEIRFDHHLGGYAKKNKVLWDFMNRFYSDHQIPTDFVYTGKLVYAFYHMVAASEIPRQSRVLLIHSGGLQGNRSLTKQELCF